MGTTTNGLPYPESTDYVTDGAQAIENLATDVDAKMGLWLVKTQTIGSAVSSVQVTDAFSADYDVYLITVSGGAASAAGNVGFQLGASTTGYYQGRYSLAYTSATFTGYVDNNAAKFSAVGHHSSDGIFVNATFNSPFLAKYTSVIANYDSIVGVSSFLVSGGHRVAASYTSFTINPASGTFTGGTIRVYGYRN